jgi:hypothetical protein
MTIKTLYTVIELWSNLVYEYEFNRLIIDLIAESPGLRRFVFVYTNYKNS